MPRLASRRGSSRTRSAYFCAPNTCTCDTPAAVEIRCAIIVSAYSSTTESGNVGELTARYMMGWSAGLVLRSDGGDGMSVGRRRWTAAMAACTSCAAASMLRSRANCKVICVLPVPLVDVIESIPAMVENCCSSTVATALAIVSGVAPGRDALTKMVGKSTLGRSLTGRSR